MANTTAMKTHNIMRNERAFFENVNETGAQEAGKREEMSAMCSLIKKCLTWKHLSQCHKSYFHISSQRRRQASKNFSLLISRTRFDGVNVDVNTFKVPLIFHVVSWVRRERKCDNLTARNCFQTFSFARFFVISPTSFSRSVFQSSCRWHISPFRYLISRTIMGKDEKERKFLLQKRCLCVLKCCWHFRLTMKKSEWVNWARDWSSLKNHLLCFLLFPFFRKKRKVKW